MTCPVWHSAPRPVIGSTSQPSPTRLSSMAGSCCCAGPTTVSSQRRTAVNRTGGERYALAFFCDAQIDCPIAAVPTCVDPGRPPRYETTYYTDYMIRYQARTYNVFDDQAK